MLAEQSMVQTTNGTGSMFVDVNLTTSNFQESNFEHSKFNRCDFSNANFKKTTFAGSVFNDVDFSRSRFRNVDLSEAQFFNCNFSLTKFDNVNLDSAYFHNCNFTAANLRGAKLHQANLSNVNLNRAMIPFTSMVNIAGNNSYDLCYRVTHGEIKFIMGNDVLTLEETKDKFLDPTYHDKTLGTRMFAVCQMIHGLWEQGALFGVQ